MNKRPFRQAVELWLLRTVSYSEHKDGRALRLAEYLYQRAKENWKPRTVKPCPFCGNVPGTRTLYRTKGQSEHIHQVVCWTCTGDSDSQVQLPVHKWNQRKR